MTERIPTPLPAPPMLALVPQTEIEMAEMIERHVNFVDEKGRSVHLPAAFVRHFMKRDDDLPRVHGFSQLPIMLPNGELLTGGGLDRKYGIIFRVPSELNRLMPKPSDCDETAVRDAMRFLVDEWLVDVAADAVGKCMIVALCLTIIERLLLPARPCFFITAGKRGSGKTTTLNLVSRAVLGHEAVAAAWSPNDEERRKALFAYLETGLPLLIWDNLTRGSTISCPSIEKALTAEVYSDRVLGVSEIRRVPAYTVQAFTGNNIGPRGDLASRSLAVRLGADRPDPENREFKHADPVAWTLRYRGDILRAMYIIMMGNPRRSAQVKTPAATRFKEWHDLVGSAVEHAAQLAVGRDDDKREPVRFKALFLEQEELEEEAIGSAEVLDALHQEWPDGFQAADVAARLRADDGLLVGDAAEWSRRVRMGLEQASGKMMRDVRATVVSWRLKALMDAPVKVGDEVLVLRYTPGQHGGIFRVEKADGKKTTE